MRPHSYGYAIDPDDKKQETPKASTLSQNASLLAELRTEKNQQNNTRNIEILEKCIKILECLIKPGTTNFEVNSDKDELQNLRSCCEIYCPKLFKSNLAKLIDRTLSAKPLANTELRHNMGVDNKGYLRIHNG